MPPALGIVAPGASSGRQLPPPGIPAYPVPSGVAGRGSPLGNNATNVSGQGQGERDEHNRRDRRRGWRAARYRLRRAGQDAARPNSNVSKCGRIRIKALGVEVCGRGDGSAFFRGVVRCGSVWECPVCSAAVTSHRAAELRLMVGAHRATGGGCYLLTLTTPHDQGDELKHLRQTVANAWRFVCSGRSWLRWKDTIGYVGTVRSAEATVGPNGWHPHLHVLLFTKAPIPPAMAALFESYVYERWAKKIQAAGYRRPSLEHGVRLTESHDDDYIAKLGLADEVASGAFKQGREGRRSPLAVLADYAAFKRDRDLLLWYEWCNSMRGARQMTWSKGLRERYATERELSDQEIVAREESGPAKVLWVIPPEHWDEGIAKQPAIQTRILEAAEDYGERGIRWILARECYPGVPF